jgi:ribosomal protein S12 methylthiotransferase
MRGKHISRSIEDLVNETKNLVRIGVKEIILIAQELTYYGLDLYKKRTLPDLLDALCEIEGLEWIRLHYAYPSKFPLEIFEVMSRQEKICNYLDIPLQHASDSVLARMKRQITNKEQRELINYARNTVPDIAIRTTLLVGFPGESEEEFNELCSFVEDMKFDRLGVFQYSHEEDTAAFLLKDDVPDDIKAERANTIMDIQQSISFENNQKKIGKHLMILIDRKEGNFFIGRSEYDSPEVDNEILVDAEKHFCRIGDFTTVRIDDAEAYDFYATPIDLN